MKYFEIKSDSKEYSLADKIYESSNAWSKEEVIKDLETAIGVNPVKNVECNTYVLRLDKIPEGMEFQFKKNLIRGKHEAFAKSDINYKYLSVIKKHKLINYGTTEFVFEIGMFGFLQMLCPIKLKDSLRYFVELKENLSENDIKTVKAKEYLAEIKESEYLRLRADMIQTQEDAQASIASV